jgi:hypothetical protein
VARHESLGASSDGRRAVLTALTAGGLWAWLVSDATRYHDGSSHLDHTSGASVVLAAAALVAAGVAAAAATTRPHRRGLAILAVAMSALACLAQTYGFLGYSAPG